jgi:molybdopterin/thiamine biosynthesis adenylyltransferase
VDAPPRDLEGIRKLLTANQRNNFNRRYRNVAKDGLARLFLIAWDRARGREALVIVADKRGEDVVATAIEVAPKDREVLKLRAGPDAETLENRAVLVFGVGAVGSQVALLLARSGLGHLVIVDDGRLRPGDVVRHAAGSWLVGEHKVTAVDLMASAYAPWTMVKPVEVTTWNPEQIRSIVGRFDLVIDTTGLAAFTSMLSLICEQEGASLVSGALYRGGSVARIRRQAAADDTPISARADDPAYLTIPIATDEELVFEPGCSAPVNNASPIAVASVAALAAGVAIDSLAGRNDYPSEIVEVYRPLPEPPFDKIGRVHS